MIVFHNIILIQTTSPSPGCTSSLHTSPQSWLIVMLLCEHPIAHTRTNTRGLPAAEEYTIDQRGIYQPQQLILWDAGGDSLPLSLCESLREPQREMGQDYRIISKILFTLTTPNTHSHMDHIHVQIFQRVSQT